MRPPRFSLATLMAATVLIGIVVAGLRHATSLWAVTSFSLAVVILATAILGAVFRRDRRRVYWTGFAVFGWGYLVLCFAPWFEERVGPHLLTTIVLEDSHSYLGPQPRLMVTSPAPGSAMTTVSTSPIAWDGSTEQENYHRIGQSLFALLFGYLGGMIATYFDAHRADSSLRSDALSNPRPEEPG
jgi:hypothetical protein